MTRIETSQTTYEQIEAKHRSLLRQEELILEVTEKLAKALNQQNMTQADLARNLGRSRSYVSQLMSGGRNLTLRTIADVAEALDCITTVTVSPRAEKRGASKHRPSRKMLEREMLDWKESAFSEATCTVLPFSGERPFPLREEPSRNAAGFAA